MKKTIIAIAILAATSAHAAERPSPINQTTTTQTLITNGTGVFGPRSDVAGEYATQVRIKDGRIEVGATKATNDPNDRLWHRGAAAGGTTIDNGTVATQSIQSKSIVNNGRIRTTSFQVNNEAFFGTEADGTNRTLITKGEMVTNQANVLQQLTVHSGVKYNGTTIEGNDISTSTISLGGQDGLYIKAGSIAATATEQAGDSNVSLATTGYVDEAIKKAMNATPLSQASVNHTGLSTVTEGYDKQSVDDMLRTRDGGIAGLAAIAGVPAFAGGTSLGLGVGAFNGAHAMAVGFAHAPHERLSLKLAVSAAESGKPVVSAGAAFKF